MSLLMHNISPVLIGSVPFYNSVPVIDKVVGLTFSLVVYGIFTDLTNVENMWVYEIRVGPCHYCWELKLSGHFEITEKIALCPFEANFRRFYGKSIS